MRKPTLEKPPSLERKKVEIITQIREYRVITPLFGGGVTPGEVDPVTPIRGTEIRGHLRFWWRATQGGRFNGKIEAMKAAEDALWGAASTTKNPGPTWDKKVELAVTSTKQHQPKRGINLSQPPLSYVAFSLEDNQTVQEGISFELKLTFPKKLPEKENEERDVEKEIEATLWAWETFGGIGARTRRGFGALQCVRIGDTNNSKKITPPKVNQAEQIIREQLNKYVVAGQWHDNVPSLNYQDEAQLKIVSNKGDDVIAAWKNLIDALRKFRQYRKGKRGFGPNLWPEPDAIRAITQNKTPNKRPLINKFPRAKFGLPIVFHFPQPGQPEDATLQGIKDQERLASPLILRPLNCANGAVGVALILQTLQEPPDGLILRERNELVEADLTETEAKRIPPLKGNTDILQAFLDTL